LQQPQTLPAHLSEGGNKPVIAAMALGVAPLARKGKRSMAHVHHFAYGWLTPGLAYGVSLLGSMLGLLCAARARGVVGSRLRRAGWLGLAAVSIGGTGIWLMHFMAMIGFSVVGSDIRYKPGLTALSAVLAIGVVWLGLAILGTGPVRWYRVVGGGVVAGLGVATMHYTGMAAMQIDGWFNYRPSMVLASVVIAITAATAALWFTVVARSTRAIIGAAAVMGFAVTGMHYVGMAAVRVHLDPSMGALDGVDVATALPPIAALAGLLVAVLLYTALSAPEEDSRYFAADTPHGRHQQPGPGTGLVTARLAAAGPAPTGSTTRGSTAASRRIGFRPLADGVRRSAAPPAGRAAGRAALRPRRASDPRHSSGPRPAGRH
jgi:NO-binding membrane sensor protein with MHYT domain